MKVETGELLSIGRFARLSGLTVKALRHYDAEGLLSPAHVDEWTGYRYYTADQAAEAVAIRRLASWSCRWTRSPPCSTPTRTRSGSGSPSTVAALQGRAVEVRQLIGTLDRLIEGKEPLVQQTTIEPRLEDVPELRVAVIAQRVAVDDMFTFVPETIERARRLARRAWPRRARRRRSRSSATRCTGS